MPTENRPTKGIDFRSFDGRQSSSGAGRAIVSRALDEVDEAGATAVRHEKDWRGNYLVHYRRLVEAGLGSPGDWLNVARAGLAELDEQMADFAPDGEQRPLTDLLKVSGRGLLATAQIAGGTEPEAELALPYRGRQLRGADLLRQAGEWARSGILEPSAVAALETLVANPDWLRLSGRTVAVLGAGAEMGPVPSLLRWGATVAAVDLPRADIWQRLLEKARRGAGTLVFPVPAGASNGDDYTAVAGANLVTDTGELSEWLLGLTGPLVLGNYAYADGGRHVRVATAADVLIRRLVQERDDVALAFLATPTDVFAVPREAVDDSIERYQGRSLFGKLTGAPLRTVSRGRLLQRGYPREADPGICDSLVPVQGPNYALAKRIQRWRAALERSAGTKVSFHVAPATRTRSVTKNRALAAAYAGAHHFGVEIFEPDTANTLMAALLVHDLHVDPPKQPHPWRDEAHEAVHGGLWRCAYAPRSALTLAAVMGYPRGRG